LLFADERISIFGLGFEDEEREALAIEQQEVTNPLELFSKLVPSSSRSLD